MDLLKGSLWGGPFLEGLKGLNKIDEKKLIEKSSPASIVELKGLKALLGFKT
jgi:hypothetical protein